MLFAVFIFYRKIVLANPVNVYCMQKAGLRPCDSYKSYLVVITCEHTFYTNIQYLFLFVNITVFWGQCVLVIVSFTNAKEAQSLFSIIVHSY